MAIKLDWLDRLIAHVKSGRVASDRSMLCGDFNVLPDECPKRLLCRTPEEKQRLDELLATGFEDLYRRADRLDRGFNYEFNPREPPTSRLQLLLGGEKVVESVACARVDLEYRAQLTDLRNQTWPSCAPVIVDLDGPAWPVTAFPQGSTG